MQRKVSEKERISRKHSQDLRATKKKLEELQIEYRDITDAKPTDVCILSMNDFELGERPEQCEKKNRPLFIDEFDRDYFYE